MLITAIAVMDENRLLGGDHGIPWKLPRDARHLRETTNGHHILLGRVTYEQMIGWFDRHIPLVLTNSADFSLRADSRGRAPGFVVRSVEEAIERARKGGETELFIGGGAQVYLECLGVTDRLLLSRIEHTFPRPSGAVYFPPFDATAWTLENRRIFATDEENPYPFRIEDWRRIGV